MSDPYIDRLIAGRYRIVRRIGEGGLGVVYLAEHVLIQKRVAIKMLRQRPDRADTRVEDLLQEARTAAKVRNDHIVDITDFGRAETGDVFLVMEHLEGTSLADEIFSRGHLDAARTLRIAEQLCNALSLSHAADVIHCDLKPDNVFLIEKPGRADFVKILDFGIARIRQLERDAAEEERGAAGTPEYMAPEQIRGQAPDASFDIYAVGCILYEMVTGSPPFTAASARALLLKHLTEPVEPPRERAPHADLPPELDAVILRALAKDPAQRFQTMRELGDALAAVRDPRTGARLLRRRETRDTGLVVDAPAAAPRRAARLLVPLAALLSIALGVGAWWRLGAPERARARAVAEVRARIASGKLLGPPDDGAYARWSVLRREHPDDARGLAAELARAMTAEAERRRAAGQLPAAIALLERAVELTPAEPALATVLSSARRAEFAARTGMVAVGSLYIDRYAYPNQAGAAPLTRVDWSAAKELCAGAQKRLCSEDEWERACTAGAVEHAREVAEWTTTQLAPGAPQIVVRGAWGREHASCRSRDYFMPGLGGARNIGFRCCY